MKTSDEMDTGELVMQLSLVFAAFISIILFAALLGGYKFVPPQIEPYSTQWNCTDDNDDYFYDCRYFPHEYGI